MPKAKKTMTLRDQKPIKDPRGGVLKHTNTAGTEGTRNQRRGHRGHGRN